MLGQRLLLGWISLHMTDTNKAGIEAPTLMAERPPRVLIVDDNQANVELLRMQLKPYEYTLEIAYNGEEALEKVKAFHPDLILLDLMMPKMDGYEVCQILKKDKNTWFIPIIVVTALRELQDKLKAIEIGADDFLIKPYNKLELVTRVKSLLRLKELHDDLDTSENILFSLARALEAKDIYTRGHSERVATFSANLAEAIGLSHREIEIIRKGALLHDIGKIGIRESVLLKPGRLTAEELEHVREHPVKGYDICCSLQSLSPTLSVIRNHHERYEGGGYPDCMCADQIPLPARIASIADSYDAMTTNRPYRKGIKAQDALEVFVKERDLGQWDPRLVDEFIKLMRTQL